MLSFKTVSSIKSKNSQEKTTIQVVETWDFAPRIKALEQAVAAGLLDEQIDAASAEARSGFSKFFKNSGYCPQFSRTC